MDGNTADGVAYKMQDLSIERACNEYTGSVKLTMNLMNKQLDDALVKNFDALAELSERIVARTNFLEKNPNFLTRMIYSRRNVNTNPLREFDEVKITLKEHSRRILEKVEEIEKYHYKLLGLVKKYSRDQKAEDDAKIANEVRKPNEDDAKKANVVRKPVEEIAKKANVVRNPDEEEAKKANVVRKPDEEEVKKANVVRKPVEDDAKKISVVREPDDDVFQDCVSETEEDNDVKAKVCVEPQTFETRKVFDRVTIRKNAYIAAEEEDTVVRPLKFQLFTDIPSEVERRKALVDLHGRLLQQLQANDSLEGFKKLMDRRPSKTPCGNQPLHQKYTGSLWFFPQKNEKHSKTTPSKTSSHNRTNSCRSSLKLLIRSSQPFPHSNQEKTKRMKQYLHRNRLEYYDLLDDIDGKDLKPIKSEYPRRDNVSSMKLHEAKTYLHTIMEESDKVWKKLLQPKQMKKNKKVKKLMDYLTAPQQKYLSEIPQTLIVMPVKILYDNFPTKDVSSAMITDLTKMSKLPSPHKCQPQILKVYPSDVKLQPLTSKTTPPTCPVRATIQTATIQTQKSKPHSPKKIPFPTHKKKEMLEQLKTLKARNDKIQCNIQSAIDVIETKMIDLLSSPTDAKNSDAFAAMEQEITKVLKMMSESKEENLNAIQETPTTSKGDGDNKNKSQRKTANIEEGERLLGQVDNVIKKIDNIYIKLQEETKSKPNGQASTTYINVMEFFDGLKNIIEAPPGEICSATYDYVTEKFQEATITTRTPIYHQAIRAQTSVKIVDVKKPRIHVPKVKIVEINECQVQVVDDEPEKGPKMADQFKVETPSIAKPEYVCKERQLTTRQLEQEIFTKIPILVKGTGWNDLGRHQDLLKTFYAFFFSGIFVALNFDYAC